GASASTATSAAEPTVAPDRDAVLLEFAWPTPLRLVAQTRRRIFRVAEGDRLVEDDASGAASVTLLRAVRDGQRLAVVQRAVVAPESSSVRADFAHDARGRWRPLERTGESEPGAHGLGEVIHALVLLWEGRRLPLGVAVEGETRAATLRNLGTVTCPHLPSRVGARCARLERRQTVTGDGAGAALGLGAVPVSVETEAVLVTEVETLVPHALQVQVRARGAEDGALLAFRRSETEFRLLPNERQARRVGRDPAETVRLRFEDYMAATLAQDGNVAAQLITPHSVARYEQARRAALESGMGSIAEGSLSGKLL